MELTPTPIANSYPMEPDIYAPRFPLGLLQCEGCGHIQVSYEVPGAELFSDYRYETPQAERPRLAAYAQKLREIYSGKVLEIGCNNGILVNELNKAGFMAVGIDPAFPQRGLPRWFNIKTADRLKETFGEFDLILGNNVFAHLDSLRQTIMAASRLLAKNGRLIFEVQYGAAMIAGGMFDMIYHEHKDYHTLAPLRRFFRKFGMCVEKVEHLPTHGGSIRVYVKHGRSDVELKDAPINFASFKGVIEAEGARLRTEIADAGGKVAAFGATAKACTLIHQFGLQDKIAYCVDETKAKQGRYIAGTDIQIVPPERLKQEPPAAILLTAWNYAEVLRPRFTVPLIVPFEKREERVAA